ncbi:MAG: hypothetical protein M3360_11665 [Actinomycetota bacterium]|nr:hypothetical protein [Actinomycetota bacterium]
MSNEEMCTAEESHPGPTRARVDLRARQLALIACVVGADIEEVERLSGR